MKRIISVLLAAVMVCTAAVIFAGCGDGNYPVTVANITIDKEPEAIVVLDPSAADIISYMNYDGKIVGRSTEVDQSYLSVAPDFGAAAEPDVNSIINSGAQVVFAGDKINDDAVKQLQEKKIQVIKMSLADTPKELETNYLTIGKILGGAVTGLEKGTSSYEKLIEHMEKLKIEVSSSTTSGALETACYLYVDDGRLRVMTSGTYVDMLIGYTGAVNVAVNIIDGNVEVNTLRIANPNYIFYSDEQTLNAIQSDDVLSKLTAVLGQGSPGFREGYHTSGTYRSRYPREDDRLHAPRACEEGYYRRGSDPGSDSRSDRYRGCDSGGNTGCNYSASERGSSFRGGQI